MARNVVEYPDWDDTYIVLYDPLLEKLSNPYIYGEKQQRILFDTGRIVVGHLRSIISDFEDVNWLVITILEGGRFYYIYDVLRDHGGNVSIGEIDIKSRFEYDPNDIPTMIVRDLEVPDINKGFDYVLIIDTIASGSTLSTMIRRLIERYKPTYTMVIGGIATYRGLTRIREILIQESIDHIFYAYGGLLGLSKNRTDMTLGDKPNYIPDILWNKAKSNLGNELAAKLCVIGDFTYSNVHIDRYLAERLVQIWEVGKASNSEDTRLIARRLILEGLEQALMITTLIELEQLLAEEYNRRLSLIGEEGDLKFLDIGVLLSLEEIK